MSGTSDHIFRENVAPVFETFVREVLGIRPITSEEVELPLPKTSERKPDYLRKVLLPGEQEPVILHIEFEQKASKKMPYRMLEYNALIRRKFELDVRQFLVLLTGRGRNMPTGIHDAGLDYRYELVRLRDIKSGSLIDSGVPELIVTAVLADLGEETLISVVRRALVTLRRQVPDHRELKKYLTQLEILSNLRVPGKTVIEEIDNMAFRYNIETDGRYLQGKEQGIVQGIVQGLEQGREQGLEQGREQIARESLKNGGSVEFTAKITGLSLDKIKQMKSDIESRKS